jgi:hypothetical protein
MQKRLALSFPRILDPPFKSLQNMQPLLLHHPSVLILFTDGPFNLFTTDYRSIWFTTNSW